ncbi:class I adenylate-forming enzyme family protein [Nocardia sp. NPDC051570]|uniref:class I adenylate-forming enzyme family protein n=1 Tax=Nocardia sp. NPDC051570 TaxID=3364324 RepID=UPI0037AACC96
MWLQQLLQRQTIRTPETVALRDQRRAVTWRGLDRDARAMAHAIGQHSRPGGRVVLLTANRVEAVEALFACALTGTILVPINPALTDREISHIVRAVSANYAIADPSGREQLARIRSGLTTLSIEDLPEPAAGWGAGPGGALGDPLAILHTSATTGLPKGVVVDQRYFQAQALSWLAEVRPEPGTVYLHPGPLCHGSMVIALNYLAADATLCVLDKFTPQAFLAGVHIWRAEHTFLVPAMIALLLDSRQLAETDLTSLRLVMHGAAPCPPELADKAGEALDVEIRTIFGITEGGGPVISLGPADQAGAATVSGATCAGLPMPGVTARIVDTAGIELAPNEIGALQLRSDGIMQGYWNNPEATESILANGWLATGDLGYRDGRGYVWIVDRRVDLILRGGQNVYPAEIEHVLRAIPWVVDVAVVAAPSATWGQLPVAFVQPAAGADFDEKELISHCVQELASYKRPSRFIRIDQLPRNAAGKVLRRQLAQGTDVQL